MSPLGKITLALIGLALCGANGFFVGMFMGHLLIDRTKLMVKLESYLSIIDDNIRLLLPYRYYRFYTRIDGHFWGKIWGMIIGGILYGVNGFIFLFIVGHFVFDTPESHHAKLWRKKFDHVWDNHWGLIGGAIVGFVCQNKMILFFGVIGGFFIDYYRLERAEMMPFASWAGFWRKINILKLWKNSKEAKHVAYITSMAGLAAKIAKADGIVTVNEIKTFKSLFAIEPEENSQVAKIFNKSGKSLSGYKTYVMQLKKIVADNLDLQENVIENLYKVAFADGKVSDKAFELLAKIAQGIGLPDGNYEVIKNRYMPRAQNDTYQSYYDELGVLCNATDAEIKSRWKKLIIKYHPDRQQAKGASAAEIKVATDKMARINFAYQEIVRLRKGK